jgi:hypothetical protein
MELRPGRERRYVVSRSRNEEQGKMRLRDLSRRAFSVGMAVAFVAGCGGSQPPIGAGPVAQEALTAQGRPHSASSSGSDLLYVASPDGDLFMFDYPSGSFVGDFDPAGVPGIRGMCTDTSGNVYVVGWDDLTVIAKFAHGATKPTWTTELSDRYYGNSCAVDPTTGNLAVFGNEYSSEDGPNVVMIFPNGSGSSGTPTYYTIPSTMAYASFCTYDNAGNLYADPYGYESSDRYVIAELPQGGSTFSIITPTKRIKLGPLQWVSGYLVASDHGAVYRLMISGSHAKIVSETKATGKQSSMWIQDSDVLAAAYLQRKKEVALWNYPQGGKPITIIPQLNKRFIDINSVLVSVEPSR